MKIRSLAVVLALSVIVLTGCTGTDGGRSDSGANIDTSSQAGACQTVSEDLLVYSYRMSSESDGLSDYTPDSMLSYQKGAVSALTDISEKVTHGAVHDALVALRDATDEMTPVLEKIVKTPEAATDGSLDGEINAANQSADDAFEKLAELCPDVTASASGTIR